MNGTEIDVQVKNISTKRLPKSISDQSKIEATPPMRFWYTPLGCQSSTCVISRMFYCTTWTILGGFRGISFHPGSIQNPPKWCLGGSRKWSLKPVFPRLPKQTPRPPRNLGFLAPFGRFWESFGLKLGSSWATPGLKIKNQHIPRQTQYETRGTNTKDK